MQQNNVKGGESAIAYNGRLIYARGYGCADSGSNTTVRPDSLMRVASVSKLFTALGVLQLAQEGKLSLDAKVFGPGGILANFQPLPGKTINPELLSITVRHLLEHAGGWDRSTTQRFNGVPYNEPLDSLVEAAPQALGNPLPGTITDVIRVMLSQPIQHTPGTYYAYSNFGYGLLGRVIEAVSGMGYEQYVQQNILRPLGIGRQKLGVSLQSDKTNGEVTYYDTPGAALVKSVFPDITAPVPRPYGGKLLEIVDSAGEWVTDAVDLCRFLECPGAGRFDHRTRDGPGDPGRYGQHHVRGEPGGLGPRVFSYPAEGKQFLSAIHLTGTVIGDVPGTLPAKPGEIVELYATGLGVSMAGVIPSAPITLGQLPVVTIGGLKAPVSYAGLVSPGLFQINATIPQVGAGPQLATIKYGGATSLTGPVIAV